MTTREKILDVAYRSFADKGYNRTSMGSIAEELGITRPALYYHFASKEDLLLATYKMVDPLVDVNVDDVLASTSIKCRAVPTRARRAHRPHHGQPAR